MSGRVAVVAFVASAAWLMIHALPARATEQMLFIRACLAEAEKAPDPQAAKNHCMWEHWEMMISLGPGTPTKPARS